MYNYQTSALSIYLFLKSIVYVGVFSSENMLFDLAAHTDVGKSKKKKTTMQHYRLYVMCSFSPKMPAHKKTQNVYIYKGIAD